MATQEFYIRNAGATEARGPFTQEQLSSLAEAGQVGLDTLYYESTSEKWVPVGANADLKNALFPEKRKLSVKAKTNVATLNVEKEDQTPITINDMLAAAEGKTDDTKHARIRPSPSAGPPKSASMLAPPSFVSRLPSESCLPSTNCSALDTNKILGQPLIFLGAFDLVLKLLLLLQMVTLTRSFASALRSASVLSASCFGCAVKRPPAAGLSPLAQPGSTSARSFWISWRSASPSGSDSSACWPSPITC